MNTNKLINIFKPVLLITSVFISIILASGCTTTSTNDESNQIVENTNIPENIILPEDIVDGPVPPDNLNISMPYYVQSGDNLSKIAKNIFSDARKWRELAEMNNIADPDHIYAGDVIYYKLNKQTKTFSHDYENIPKAKIITQKGDTLSYIAQIVLGDAKNWRTLWKENPHIKNPHLIEIGIEIYFKPNSFTTKITSPSEHPENHLKTNQLSQDEHLQKFAFSTDLNSGISFLPSNTF